MKLFTRRQHLPLLRKEMLEQAARRRTYIVRFVYAVLLFLCFLLFFYNRLSVTGQRPSAVMGCGKDMFKFVVTMQFIGIFVFLPATMSSALTYEKERRSLSLLFLTDLRPWEIVLQKYFGHLIPMFTFLLLSLPILAIAYAFGGISTDYLCSGIFLLVVACLQVGALSLMFSSYCAGTVQAFISSYLMSVLFYLGIAVPGILLNLFSMGITPRVSREVMFALVPPYIFVDTQGDAFADVLVRSIPSMISITFFLLMARVFLLPRAFVPRRNVLLSVFKRLDAFWHKANKLTGGIVLIREPDTLPEHDPIAWREINKRSVGSLSHLVRLLLLIEVPVAFTIWGSAVIGGFRGGVEGLSLMLLILWPLAALMLVVQSANAFVSERSSQTLDVLLATPISGRDIVRQKVRGLRRIMLVMAIPIVSVVLCEAWLEYGHTGDRPTEDMIIYLLSSLLSVAVYFPMISWVSLWIGMRARTRSRAIIVSLAVVVSWCALPILILLSLQNLLGAGPRPLSSSLYVLLVSPGSIITITESRETLGVLSDAPLLVPITISYIWHGMILFWFRWLCLHRADRYLGRVTEDRGKPVVMQSESG